MILITGADGFIGHNLVQALEGLLPEISIRAFDIRFSSLKPTERIKLFHGSIEDSNLIMSVTKKVDIIVHLAAKVSPHSKDIDNLTRINVQGSINLYNAAIKQGCQHFIYLSSAGVYGPPRKPIPFRETDTSYPITPYQQTKWQAEKALRGKEAKQTSLNILRPAGIYGPGSFLEIPTYKRVLHKKRPIELKGGVIVQPTYITELVNAILAILNNPAPHGEIFNFGGQRTLRVQDLEALIAKILGVRRYPIILPSCIAVPLSIPAGALLSQLGRPNPLLRRMAKGELFSSAVDDSKFRQRYPDIPVVDLDKGLREHIDWARNKGLMQ